MLESLKVTVGLVPQPDPLMVMLVDWPADQDEGLTVMALSAGKSVSVKVEQTGLALELGI
jgi:hypothetical protein